jgi:CHAT domain-containing protein
MRVTVMSVLLLCSPLCTSASAGPLPLEVGRAVTVSWPADGSATLSFDTEAGDFARLEVVQTRGVARLEATTAGGRYLRGGRSASQTEPAMIDMVLAESTTVRVELSPARGEAEGGESRVTLTALRPATDAERLRVGADMALDDGNRLVSDGSADALKAAIVRFDEARDLYARGGDRKMEGVALDSSGWVHDLLGEKRKAIAIYRDALEIRREVGDVDGEIFTLLGIGLIYNYFGEIDKALECNEYALKLARETANRRQESNLLHNIGGLHWVTDEMQAALDNYRESLEIRNTLDDPVGLSSTLNNIGDVYRRLGDDDRAMEYFERALEIRTSLGNKRGMAHSLHTMGLVYSSRGEWETARDTFQRALDLRRETGDKRGVAFSLGGLSNAAWSLGDVETAIAYSDETIALWKEMGEIRSLGESLWKRGLMLIDLGNIDDAKLSLDEALGIARTVRDRTSEATALYGLARLERRKENLDGSIALIEEAIAIVESLRGKISSEDLRASYLASVSTFYDFYVSVQMELDRKSPGSGFAARALETSERARARSLLDSLTAAAVGTLLESGSERAVTEQSLRARIQRLDRQVVKLAAGESDAAELALAQTRLDGALAEYQALLDEIRESDPRLSELLRPRTLSVPEIQALLDDGTALIEFALGQTESFAWVVTADRLVTAVLPPRAEIDAQARAIYDSLTARNEAPDGESIGQRRERVAAADAQGLRSSASLAKALLGGIREAIEGHRLVVVADGALQYLPFAALPDPGSPDGEPLLARHEVVGLPSASLLPLLRQKTNDDREDAFAAVAIVADPVFRADDSRVARREPLEELAEQDDPNRLLLRSAAEAGLTAFPRLRFSRREAEAIRSFLEPGQVLEVTDFDANLDTLVHGRLAASRVLHLATHGILNSRNPQLSGLVFSLVDETGNPRPGFLRLADIYGLQLQADLVVLSACQTALGREIRGEGLIGLTRGFMHAGAPRVISSLWRVDDRATAELMKRVYRNLIENGQHPSSALRSAQLELRNENGWSAPYYWAAFVMQGDWHPWTALRESEDVETEMQGTVPSSHFPVVGADASSVEAGARP